MKKDIVKEPTSAYDSQTFTYADYLKFSYDEMVEIIRGKVFKMSPAPVVFHQVISTNLTRIISTYLIGLDCLVFHSPIDVVLPIANKKRGTSDTVVQPDLCVICDPSIIEEAAIFGPPDLIIEILSPHTKKKDLQLKYDVYEESGVKEYWIVMPQETLVEVFVLHDVKYQRINTYTEEDTVTSNVIKGLEVNLGEVFV